MIDGTSIQLPDTTSAEGLDGYMESKCLARSRGPAWQGVRASLFLAPRRGDTTTPAVNEPLLQWTASGEVEIEERENDGPWIKSIVRQGSFFLISSSGPYDCRWRVLSQEPFEHMAVLLDVPLLQAAFEEMFGAADALKARLRDVSGFYDERLNSLMVQLLAELKRRKASALAVQGLARVVAVHLARNYSEVIDRPHPGNFSLPGFKLRRIIDWMAENYADDFGLDHLAQQAGVSKFHFHRLFKNAVGVPPSEHHMNLRLQAARQLLRETTKSVMDVALEVGYRNPSYFAQVFKKDVGQSPSEYRRQA